MLFRSLEPIAERLGVKPWTLRRRLRAEQADFSTRSEERRVGKECKSRVATRMDKYNRSHKTVMGAWRVSVNNVVGECCR